MVVHRVRVLLSSAAALVVLVVPASPAVAQVALPTTGTAVEPAFSDLLPLEDFSPTVLGIYRKVMEIEAEIRAATDRYGVDYDLARAVCMYESGGNANLTSWAGARGYFQVMPATMRTLGVSDNNIEGGVKYLGQMVQLFDREDYALAAYNGGPGNVGKGRAMRLESLQYVLGVGHYRHLLKAYERSLRHHASQLLLTEVQAGEDWRQVSRRLGMSLLQLRLHNPYLAVRQLVAGQLIAYPAAPREDLFQAVNGDRLSYAARLGDNYFNLAFALDIDLDRLRQENSLWHLQTLGLGQRLTLPLDWESNAQVHRVASGETVDSIAVAAGVEPWRIVRDNGLLWDETLQEGMLLRWRTAPAKPEFVVHRVASGENLTAIAHRYGTSVSSIQEANSMGRRTVIRVGEQLRIPTAR